MELFDIVKLIFSDNYKSWSNVGSNEKSRNFFMINRIMSIQYPIQADQFNKLKVIPGPVVDWWHDTLSKRFSRPPQWIYTKTSKKKSEEKKKEDKNLDSVENFIRDKYEVSNRDLYDLKKFYPEKYQIWIKDISDQLGIKNSQ